MYISTNLKEINEKKSKIKLHYFPQRMKSYLAVKKVDVCRNLIFSHSCKQALKWPDVYPRHTWSEKAFQMGKRSTNHFIEVQISAQSCRGKRCSQYIVVRAFSLYISTPVNGTSHKWPEVPIAKIFFYRSFTLQLFCIESFQT